MKRLNLTVSLLFGTLGALAAVVSLIQMRFPLMCIALILIAVSYVAWLDYKHPE
jgi:hypothetical protein